MKKDNQKEHRKAVNEGRPGYKHTPLGWIPEDWEAFELGELTKKIMVGIATESRSSMRESGVPFIRNQNIKSGHFDDKEIIYISKEFDLLNKNKRLKAGDVIIVRTGSNVGQACVVPRKFENAQTFTTLIVRPSEKIDSNYLSLHINSFGIREVERLSAGGGKPNLNAGFLENYRILLPTISEQMKIESILSVWDSAITKTQQLIEQLKQRNKGLMGEFLTGKRRLAQYTDKWQIVKIGDIITESRIPSVSNNPNKRITVRLNLKGVEKRSVRGTEAEDATYYFVRSQGQFIYGKQNLHKGAFGLIPKELDQYESSQDIPAFDFSAGFDPNFFLYFLGQEQVYSSLEKYATGTGSKRIHPENLFRVQFRYPSFREQKSIANILVKMSQELTLYENILFALQKQKKSMMQKLLNGEIRTI